MSLWDTIKEALRLRDAMKADGASAAALAAGLEKTLRVSWPFRREWHYLCPECSDYGVVDHVCRPGFRCPGISTRTDSPKDRPGKYKRLCAMDPYSDYEHTYVTPCFCPAGAKFRPMVQTAATDVERAAKTPAKMTRLGR